MKITAAGNIEAPAYHTLVAKGYDVTCVDAGEMWIARKGNAEISADGALPLLGIVALLEARGAHWPATDSEIDVYLACLASGQ